VEPDRILQIETRLEDHSKMLSALERQIAVQSQISDGLLKSVDILRQRVEYDHQRAQQLAVDSAARGGKLAALGSVALIVVAAIGAILGDLFKKALGW